ncbi:hypothetical protein [Amycolatopsis sp.]|uniref:hypothetical protein n=1 Tax=Amycolatopsis sp. TaxID=37632 RepID=UPI002DF80EB2|nr:hypothetical protein [Amycolatopsis sp.]
MAIPDSVAYSSCLPCDWIGVRLHLTEATVKGHVSRRGRDSFYCSTQEFKDVVATAQANREGHQPELVALREEIGALKRERKQTASDHAATTRELEENVRVYANQIPVLALWNAELEDRARQLHRRLADADPDVIPLPDRTLRLSDR